MKKAVVKISKKRKATENVELNMKQSRLFECPICFDALKAPIYQCLRGHLLCETCEKKCSKCPSCEVSLAKKIRNIAMEELSEAVLHECPNGVDGCEWKGQMQDLNKHLDTGCQYEEANYCSTLGILCSQYLMRIEWSSHLKKIHGVNVVDAQMVQIDITIPELSSASAATVKNLKYKPVCLFTSGNVFVVTTHVDVPNKAMAWMVRYLGPGKPEDYYCKIQVIRRNSSKNIPMFPIAMHKGPIFDISQEYESHIGVLTIGYQFLQDLRNRGEKYVGIQVFVKRFKEIIGEDPKLPVVLNLPDDTPAAKGKAKRAASVAPRNRGKTALQARKSTATAR